MTASETAPASSLVERLRDRKYPPSHFEKEQAAAALEAKDAEIEKLGKDANDNLREALRRVRNSLRVEVGDTWDEVSRGQLITYIEEADEIAEAALGEKS